MIILLPIILIVVLLALTQTASADIGTPQTPIQLLQPTQPSTKPTGLQMSTVKLPQSVNDLIDRIAPDYGLDPRLIKAQCWAESRGNPNVVSSAGAKGLMQLEPATFTGLGYNIDNILDPETNMSAGCQYMAQLLVQNNGDTPLALAAYNAGQGNVKKYGGIPPFPETVKYVAGIVANYNAELAS